MMQMNVMRNSTQNALFDEDDDSDYYQEIQQQRKAQMNEVGFQELDKTCEYMETHYYK